jgi:glucose-6-phosphate isomerase
MNLDKTAAYKRLKKLAKKFEKFDYAGALDAVTVRGCNVPITEHLHYNWAAKRIHPEVLAALQELADEQNIIEKYKALAGGAVYNTGERRKVLHHLTRGDLVGKVAERRKDLGLFYRNEFDRSYEIIDLIHRGQIVGSTGKLLRRIVQVGIGGSDLGPRALYLGLEGWASRFHHDKMKADFISNVDPDDGVKVLSSLNYEETVFILVSKSGTTQETLVNERMIRRKLTRMGMDPSKHFIAVTSQNSPLAKSKDYLCSFYIDDYIGGRYSATSVVGGIMMAFAYGHDAFREILRGAHDADLGALEPNIQNNAAALDALIGVWERNFMGYNCTAVLPYSQALLRFPAHLQQLDMESNGKSVNRAGKPVKYETGPVVFGEPGTNGQHSFYQLLHQGTGVVPLQFIGFEECQRCDDIEVDGSTSQKKLNANLAAQIVAFAKGKASSELNKNFAGGRPSSLIYGKQLTPKTLGALLAHYENKVMFQGFLWNLNSFDQEGVQLGKVLTKKALSGKSEDSVLDEYCKILGV